MNRYEISEDVVNNILLYLSKQPYAEVFQLINNIQNNLIIINNAKENESI